MIVCLDTSVLVAAFTVEPESTRARHWLAGEATWRISDWAAAEFSSALRIKARQGRMPSGEIADVERALDALIGSLDASLRVDAEDHRAARALIVQDGGLRAPDALHIVIARRNGASLATFDTNQARAAAAARVAIFHR